MMTIVCTRNLCQKEGSAHGTAHPKRLRHQVRDAFYLKHYSCRIEQAHVGWIRLNIYFHDVRHPSELSSPEVEAFLTNLAIKGSVAGLTRKKSSK